MSQEHPIDRFMRTFRKPLMVLAVISAPVFLLTYALGMKMLLESVSLWLVAPIGICHVMAWIGVASLFDARQEQEKMQVYDPPARRPRS